jgi:hypothetical protein
METKVSIDARVIRRYPDDEALAAVENVLGPPQRWAPSLIEYRLSSDFQADWKCEVGCWLLNARDLGYLDRLESRLRRALIEAAQPKVTGPNDSAHRILVHELTGAMVTYYFAASGWRFVSWEPPVRAGDVDGLLSPAGLPVDVQVKAPDQPGSVVRGRIVGGEFDDRVLKAIDKAMAQLEPAPGHARMVVVSPQRSWNIKADVLACHMLGRPGPRAPESWGISRESGGAFAHAPGSSISALVDLGLVRGPDETLYRSTVICNPWIGKDELLGPEVFPHARVLSLDAGKFVWAPKEPSRCSDFRNGVPYLG